MTVKPVKVSKLIEVERILDFEEASFLKKKSLHRGTNKHQLFFYWLLLVR